MQNGSLFFHHLILLTSQGRSALALWHLEAAQEGAGLSSCSCNVRVFRSASTKKGLSHIWKQRELISEERDSGSERQQARKQGELVGEKRFGEKSSIF